MASTKGELPGRWHTVSQVPPRDFEAVRVALLHLFSSIWGNEKKRGIMKHTTGASSRLIVGRWK
jgi:hypothetical protein